MWSAATLSTLTRTWWNRCAAPCRGRTPVCDLAALLGMTQSAISHQLRALKNARLVKARRDGKTVFYSLADQHVKTILDQGLEHISE